MRSVLIIEDDINLVNLLRIHLQDIDFRVEFAGDGSAGLHKAMNESFDLIILDLMLPGQDGISICQKLRALGNFIPILMLTAKSEEFDKVMGLESGADDYMTKPFGIRELIARVKAIIRRQENKVTSEASSAGNTTIAFGELEIDLNKRRVMLQGKRVELTPKEFDLLSLIARHPGKSYNREQLLNEIWGYEFTGYEHTVNSHINRLRAKIEPDLARPKYILTTWGHGYRFNDDL